MDGSQISLIRDRHIGFYFPAMDILYSTRYTGTVSEPGRWRDQKTNEGDVTKKTTFKNPFLYPESHYQLNKLI